MGDWADSLLNGILTTATGYNHDRPVDTSPKPTKCWVCRTQHPSRRAASRCIAAHTREERIAAGGGY